MSHGRNLFRRKIIWTLLLGTVGGTVCAQPARILDSSRTADDGANDPPVALRLSTALGRQGKASSRNPLKKAARLEASAPLRLSYAMANVAGAGTALVVRGGGAIAAKAGVAGPAMAAGAERLSSARRSPAGDEPDQPEAPLPFDPPPVAGAKRRPAAAEKPGSVPLVGTAGTSELPDLSGETWVIAPIRWSGNTNSTMALFAGEGSNNLSDTNSVNLKANSFIVAPYIALWSGLLGYSAIGTQFTSANGPKVKTKSDFLNFGGTVDMFPVSRFPFSASIMRSTSATRVDTGSDSEATTNTVVNAHQSYRTEDGRDNYMGAFSHSLAGNGKDTSGVMSLQGSYSTAREFEYEHLLEGSHTLSVNAGMTSATADLSGQKSRLLNSTLNHGWKVHEDLSIFNTLGASFNQSDTVQGNALVSSDSKLFYGSSSVSWRPFEDMPLTLAGGGNFSLSQTRTVGGENSLRNITGFMSGSYRFNTNLSFAGNASVGATSSNSLSNIFSNLGASVSYSGDPIRFEYFNYGWGLGGGVNNFASTRGGSSFNANASASHSLNRSISITDGNILNLTASQSISQSIGKNIGQPNFGTAAIANSSTSLSTAFGAAWRASYGTQLTGDLSANLADNMSTGIGGTSHYQTMSLAGNGVYQVTSRAAISVDANLTWTGNNSANGGNAQALNGIIVNNNASQLSGTFGLSYSHRNPFSIERLGYNARLFMVNSQMNRQLVGDASQPVSSQLSTSLQQSFDYRYGRLVFSLNGTFFDQAGRKNASLFGSVTREFDGFFDGRW